MTVTILKGDCRDVLRTLPAESVHCVVTSPPYWGLRDYGVPPSIWGGAAVCEHQWGETVVERATNHTDKRRWQHTRNGRDEEQPTEKRVGWLRSDIPQGQFCRGCGAWAGAHGLEPTFDLFVQNEVEIFRQVRRVLRPDGTLWLNLGDSYATGAGKVGGVPGGGEQGARWAGYRGSHAKVSSGKASYRMPDAGLGPIQQPNRMPQRGLKPKDLCGIPWRVAFALQADGWWLRQDIIWSKPNPMPESATDRCTKAHEYVFLLAKSERYYFDQQAILEPITTSSSERLAQPTLDEQEGSHRVPGKTNGPMKAVRRSGNKERKPAGLRGVPGASMTDPNGGVAGSVPWEGSQRNRRSVWQITTQPFSEAHFATFPPTLVEPCVRAGAPAGGMVLDPFGGSGTVGLVADRLGRNATLIELNPEYAAMAERRIRDDAPLFTNVAT